MPFIFPNEKPPEPELTEVPPPSDPIKDAIDRFWKEYESEDVKPE